MPEARMADRISAQGRSDVMRRIRKTDTRPELAVRRLVHALGYRYRLYRRNLPGTPDLVFSRRRKVIFVHGCFWHQHECPLGRMPKSRLEYWGPKLCGNRERDERNRQRLNDLGWTVMIIWECEVADLSRIEQQLRHFLGPEIGRAHV